MLEYIYCSQTKLTEEFALELFVLANQWRFEGLETYCEEYLTNHLTLGNIVDVCEVVEILDLKRLKANVIEFVSNNLKEMKENEDLKKLSGVILADILFKLHENKK